MGKRAGRQGNCPSLSEPPNAALRPERRVGMEQGDWIESWTKQEKSKPKITPEDSDDSGVQWPCHFAARPQQRIWRTGGEVGWEGGFLVRMASSGGSFHRRTAEGKYIYLRTSSSSIRQRSSLMGPQVMASLQRSSTATSRRTVCWMPEFWKCSRSSEMLGHRSENSTWRTTWAILNNTWLKQHLIKWHLINTILSTSIHYIDKSSVLAWPASHEWPRFQQKPGPGHVLWSCPLKETWIWPQTRFCELVRIKFLSVKSHSIKYCFNWLLIKCLMIKCWIKCHAAKDNNTKTHIFLFACFLFLLVTFLLLAWLNFVFVLK